MDKWAHLNLLSRICIWKVETLPDSQLSQFSLFILGLITNMILHLSVSASTGGTHISNEKCHRYVQRFILSHCSFQISISSSMLKIGMKELSLASGPAEICRWEVTEETSWRGKKCPIPISNKWVTAPEYEAAMDFSENNRCLLGDKTWDTLVPCCCSVWVWSLWERRFERLLQPTSSESSWAAPFQ